MKTTERKEVGINHTEVEELITLDRLNELAENTYISCYRLLTLRGSLDCRHAELAVGLYNRDKDTYGLTVVIEVDEYHSYEMLMHYKEDFGFPADADLLYRIADKLEYVADLEGRIGSERYQHLLHKYTTENLNEFQKFYYYAPELMDEERWDIQKRLYNLRQLVVTGDVRQSVSDFQTLSYGIGKKLEDFLTAGEDGYRLHPRFTESDAEVA